ncbi:hypothetical protein TREMEDRAFT_64482 [Tremella mesenterica DSM 1558]|uniref:uncharacterized protein n=1 Tax=Tremella mesenterica (strain ATCC 24925 / CBS 8224 / DSM 1558 / NBRC 9311 / NRRL Y-6157 / RJB 2259-6 / UBC 559-6) TaxID=578456 RepID=UPI0003F4A102|nr:uncharacterized protein TREMEDRAFT_64482 [Tremella mesenterica DSM 1558]EIW67233.1 hypothetical protein TREMEDRAFT_64482 [Tremella mesenterica DSM 1558]
MSEKDDFAQLFQKSFHLFISYFSHSPNVQRYRIESPNGRVFQKSGSSSKKRSHIRGTRIRHCTCSFEGGTESEFRVYNVVLRFPKTPKESQLSFKSKLNPSNSKDEDQDHSEGRSYHLPDEERPRGDDKKQNWRPKFIRLLAGVQNTSALIFSVFLGVHLTVPIITALGGKELGNKVLNQSTLWNWMILNRLELRLRMIN